VTDIVLSAWVDHTSLGIAEELVNSIESGALPDFVTTVHGDLVNSVVDRTVSRALLRG